MNHLSNSAEAISPIIAKRFMVYDITMSPNAIDSRYCIVRFICCHNSAFLMYLHIFFCYHFCCCWLALLLLLLLTVHVFNGIIIDLLSKLAAKNKPAMRSLRCVCVCVFAYMCECALYIYNQILGSLQPVT